MSNALMMDDHMGPPDPKPTPQILSDLDRLKAENLALQIQNVSMHKERYLITANQQVEAFDSKLKELREAISNFQQHLSKVYGIDFTKQQIERGTGRIIPAPNQPS